MPNSIGRISTFAIHQSTLQDASRVQADLFDLQGQISSGLKTDNFAGLPGQVERFVDLEAKIAKSKTFVESNSVVLARLKTGNTYMDELIAVADGFQDLLTQRRNPANVNAIKYQEQAIDLQTTFANLLNGTFEGKYMFGGTRTNVPPVITDPVIPGPVETGVPDDAYYQGSKEDIILRADSNVEITYNVRADNSAFQKIFAAFSQGFEAHEENNDGKFAEAIGLVNEGIQDLISVQASVNSDIVNLENTNDRHNKLILFWQGVTEEVSKTDILSASTQVAVNQAVLSATFQTFAQVNRLRLIDYLR